MWVDPNISEWSTNFLQHNFIKDQSQYRYNISFRTISYFQGIKQWRHLRKIFWTPQDCKSSLRPLFIIIIRSFLHCKRSWASKNFLPACLCSFSVHLEAGLSYLCVQSPRSAFDNFSCPSIIGCSGGMIHSLKSGHPTDDVLNWRHRLMCKVSYQLELYLRLISSWFVK